MSIMYTPSAAFTLAVLQHRETFSSYPECNSAARLFFFSPRTVSHGWYVTMAILYGLLLARVHPDDHEAALPHNLALGIEAAEDRQGALGGGGE
jgi:hypothetical protein